MFRTCARVFLVLLLAAPPLAAGPGKAGAGPSGGEQRNGDDPPPLGPPGEGRATVSWEAPTRRSNGECLDDLAGFKVSWGPMRSRLDREVRLTPEEAACQTTDRSGECGPVKACSYTVRELGPIKWYFTVQAYDGQDRESAAPTAVFLDMD